MSTTPQIQKHGLIPIMADLKLEAKRLDLWNLFLPEDDRGAGLLNPEYAPIAKLTGWSPSLAPEALNCSAPDTGNMELLSRFGTPEQQENWLKPLLAGKNRFIFSMTEPEVASGGLPALFAPIPNSPLLWA